MRKYIFAATAIFATLPLVGYAQVARNGNEYNFRDNQPTAAVQSQERRLGVAPDAVQSQNQNDELQVLDKDVLQRAQHDAQVAPNTTQNVYGVQPGGVVPVSPNATGGGGRAPGGSP